MGNQDKNLNDGKYHYDAFISYRHCQPDQFVAETLHKQLENFKLPANVVKKMQAEGKADKDAKTRITRVFRDQEELPLATNLEDPIVDALKNSEWLIVICSPRLKESMWCKKEIETFIKLRGRDHVMAVLADGEPADSFPQELLTREVEIEKPDGTKEIVVEPVEPLAADVRGEDNKARQNAVKSEMIRLLAPMFGLQYDELKQRHRERKIRKAIAAAVTVAVICFLFGVLGTVSAITINGQKNEISKQKDEIEAKSIEIEEQAEEIANQNDALKVNQAENLALDAIALYESDDRIGAINMAYAALTENNGIKMPYTDKARYALMKSLRPYDLSGASRAEYQVQTRGIIEDIFASPSRKYILIYDSSSTLTFWDVENKKIANIIVLGSNQYIKDNFIFKDDDTLLFSDMSNLYEYDVESGEKTAIVEEEMFSFIDRVRYDYSTGITYYKSEKKYIGLDSNYNKCFECEIPEDELAESKFRYLPDSYVVVNSTLKDKGDDKIAPTVVRIFDPEANEIFKVQYSNENYENSYKSGDDLFILTTKYNRYNDSIISTSSILRSYSLESGKLNWERENLNIAADKLALINDGGDDCIVEIGKHGIVEVDKNTGELYVASYEDSDIVWAGAVDNAIVYMTTAPIKMYLTNHTTMGLSSAIDCHLSAISLIECTADGYFMVEKNSNKFVYYTEMDTDNFEDYDGDYTAPETENYGEFSEAEEIKALELEGIDTELIRNVAFDSKKKKACVTGKDGIARLYDLSTKEQISSWTLASTYDSITEYLGEDNDGNVYWAGEQYGYCISANNNVIAEMEILRGVDAKNNQLIFGATYDDTRACAPIYSTDDLLKMAEEFVEK